MSLINIVLTGIALTRRCSFQNNNNGKGGKAADRVTISVQDAAGTDNADFSTPPDGQSGRMRMFLWDLTSPGRDGALENDIVVHEMTHGITNRMTGGGTGRCLHLIVSVADGLRCQCNTHIVSRLLDRPFGIFGRTLCLLRLGCCQVVSNSIAQ